MFKDFRGDFIIGYLEVLTVLDPVSGEYFPESCILHNPASIRVGEDGFKVVAFLFKPLCVEVGLGEFSYVYTEGVPREIEAAYRRLMGERSAGHCQQEGDGMQMM
jgi:hypothetical protein